MKSHFIICSCQSSDHLVRFIKDENDVWVEVQLNPTKNIFGRMWAALKYICGYKSKYGHWDCTLISRKERNKLFRFLRYNR